MGYKIGFVLSLLLLVELFILAADVFSAQIIYTNLDAASLVAGNAISQSGGITEEVVRYIEETTGGYIVNITTGTPRFGDIYEYKVARSYQPMTAFGEEREISVIRGVVIGYYN